MSQRKPPQPHKNSAEEKPQQKPERLQKVMAAAGLGSRRMLEKQIKSGKVLINRETASIGQSASAGDHISF